MFLAHILDKKGFTDLVIEITFLELKSVLLKSTYQRQQEEKQSLLGSSGEC